MKRLAWLLLLAALPAYATTYFSDDFETCDGSAWSGTLGTTAYANSGCHAGTCCGKKTVASGEDNVSMFWYKSSSWSVSDFYIRAAWKFPSDYRFASNNGADFKAVILEPSHNLNRMFMKFITASPTSAQVKVIVEGPNATYISHNQGGTEITMTPDDTWHTMEAHWVRAVGVNAGHVTVWVDDVLHIDSAITTCNVEYNGGACAPIIEFKAGCYQNWTAPADQFFYLDSVTFTDTKYAYPPSAGTRRLVGVP